MLHAAEPQQHEQITKTRKHENARNVSRFRAFVITSFFRSAVAMAFRNGELRMSRRIDTCLP